LPVRRSNRLSWVRTPGRSRLVRTDADAARNNRVPEDKHIHARPPGLSWPLRLFLRCARLSGAPEQAQRTTCVIMRFETTGNRSSFLARRRQPDLGQGSLF
jgi:hypothetical protein